MHGGHLSLHFVLVSNDLTLSLYQVSKSQELPLKMKLLSAEDFSFKS